MPVFPCAALPHKQTRPAADTSNPQHWPIPRQLRRALADRPTALIVRGPSGLGKTTSVKAWLIEQPAGERVHIQWLDGDQLADGLAELRTALLPPHHKTHAHRSLVIVDNFDRLDADELAHSIVEILTSKAHARLLLICRTTTLTEQALRESYINLRVLTPHEFALPPGCTMTGESLTARAHEIATIASDSDEFFRALQRASCFDVVPVTRLAEVIPRPHTFIQTAEQCGLGYMDADQQCFTIAQPFRDALRSDLRERFPEDYLELRRDAADADEARGDTVNALFAFVEIGDYSAATQLIVHSTPTLLDANIGPIVEVLDAIPQSELDPYPLLTGLLAMGLFRNLEQQWRAVELTNRASRNITSLPTPSSYGERALLLYLRLLGTRMGRGAQESALREEVNGLLQFLNRHGAALRAETPLWCIHLYTVIAETQLQLGSPQAAIAVLERGAVPYLQGPASSDALTYGVLAASAAIAGEMPLAVHALHHHTAARTHPGYDVDNHRFELHAQVAQIWMHLERAEFAEARRQLEREAKQWVTYEAEHLFTLPLAMTYIGLHQPELGLFAVEKIHANIHRHRVATANDEAWYAHARGILLIAMGHIASANDLLTRLSKLPRPVPPLDRACLAIIRRQYRDATEALTSIPHNISPRRETTWHLLASAAALATNDRSTARTELTRAAFLLASYDLRTPLMMLDSATSRALIRFSIDDSAQTYLDFRERAETTPFLIDNLHSSDGPTLLTTRELVVLEALQHYRSTADIAAHMSVSPNTVKTHLRNLYKKLGVHSRTDALHQAAAQHLI